MRQLPGRDSISFPGHGGLPGLSRDLKPNSAIRVTVAVLGHVTAKGNSRGPGRV